MASAVSRAQELGERGAIAVGLHGQPGQPLGAIAFDELGQLVQLLAAVAGQPFGAQAFDLAARRYRVAEYAEVAAGHQVGDVGQLHAKAQVGLSVPKRLIASS